MDQDPLSSLKLAAWSLLKFGPSTIGWIFLIPDPLRVVFYTTWQMHNGSGISPNHYRQYINVC